MNITNRIEHWADLSVDKTKVCARTKPDATNLGDVEGQRFDLREHASTL
jgi:hypothetical protein